MFFLVWIFLGLGIIFKQVLIPLAVLTVIYIFLKEKNLKAALIHLLGIFLPISLIAIYLISIGVLKDFWYWTVMFNLTTYAQSGRGLGPTQAHFTRALFIFGSAFLFLEKKKKR